MWKCSTPRNAKLITAATASGATRPIVIAERSRNRWRRSFHAMTIAAGTPSLSQCRTGQVEEHRFEVGLDDLHAAHARRGVLRNLQHRGQRTATLAREHVHLVALDAGALDARQRAHGGG